MKLNIVIRKTTVYSYNVNIEVKNFSEVPNLVSKLCCDAESWNPEFMVPIYSWADISSILPYDLPTPVSPVKKSRGN